MERASSKKAVSPEIRDVEERLAEIKQMSVKQLQALWQELHGAPTNTRNRPFLQKRLAFRVQELGEGGLSEKAKDKAGELQGKAPGPRKASASDITQEATPVKVRSSKRGRDPRLPKAGSVIEREHKGKMYKVTVHDTDFEHAGARYASLSTLAREITGQVWNGYLFFGLTGRAAKKGAE